MRLPWSQSRHYPDFRHDHTRPCTLRWRKRNEHCWHVLDADRGSGYYGLWDRWRVYVVTAVNHCPRRMLIKVLACRSGIFYISFRVGERIHAQTQRPDLHPGDQSTSYLRWPTRIMYFPHCLQRRWCKRPFDRLASLLWHRDRLPSNDLLLAYQDDELAALPTRRDPQASALLARHTLLLAILDRDLWHVVPI